MEGEEVQYLDYVRPQRERMEKERYCPVVIQEIWEQLKKYREQIMVKPQPKREKYKVRILIQLQTHQIVAKVGKYNEQETDAIILPYRSSELEYKPAIHIREELQADREKIKGLNSKPGELYLRSKKLLNFKFRAFIKVEVETATKDLIDGLKSLIKLVKQKQIAISTITIVFSSQLFNLENLFQSLLDLQLVNQQKSFTLVLLLSSRKMLNTLYNVLQ